MVTWSRRNALGIALMVAAGGAARAQDGTCVSPDDLSPTERAQRDSLHYTNPSPDQASTCSACAFFSDPDSGCGKCQILGGVVAKGAHCDSWTKGTQ